MRRKIVVAIVGVLALAGIVTLLRASGPPEDEEGRPRAAADGTASRSNLGDVEGIKLDGFDNAKPVVLTAFEGKPLVVNYWASWCLFCIEEMPDFQAVYEEVREDVEFLGVNIQDNLPQAKQLLEVTKVSYPLASDPSGDIYRTLKGVSMPTTVFVDERGEIIERFSGPLDAERLRERIRKHFDV